MFHAFVVVQRRSRNADKVTHINGSLLERAVILINYVPFQNRHISLRKEIAPRGSKFFSLREVPYGMEIQYYRIWQFPLLCTISITHVRNCVMGATPMRILTFFNVLFSNIFQEHYQSVKRFES